jgi:DNA-cytosine methyltransferase
MQTENKGINVLSMFDGMSCGQLALQRAGVKVDKYFSSEIDKHAIAVTQANFPSTVQLGDIQTIGKSEIEELKKHKIDLVIGGSPCQGFSFAGKNLNFDDPRSKLFFNFVGILKALKPRYFLLENVRMNKRSQSKITELLGVAPVVINSNLVSAQNRHRLYWTNIPFDMPEARGLVLQDILQPAAEVDAKYSAGERLLANFKGGNQLNSSYKSQANTIHDIEKPSPALMAGTHGYAHGHINLGISSDNKKIIRKLTPTEFARLQTVPDSYCGAATDTQKYKMLGNGWTVDVVAHIFKGVNCNV